MWKARPPPRQHGTARHSPHRTAPHRRAPRCPFWEPPLPAEGGAGGGRVTDCPCHPDNTQHLLNTSPRAAREGRRGLRPSSKHSETSHLKWLLLPHRPSHQRGTCRDEGECGGEKRKLWSPPASAGQLLHGNPRPTEASPRPDPAGPTGKRERAGGRPEVAGRLGFTYGFWGSCWPRAWW